MKKFKSFSKSDLKDLLYYLNKMDFLYREKLNINNQNLTFGVELEFSGLSFLEIDELNRMKKFSLPLKYGTAVNDVNDMEFKFIEERTCGEDGCEIITPVLKDKIKDWKTLKIMCQELEKNGALISQSCATHLHFGAHVLANNYSHLRDLIKMWVVYEKIFYNFYYGFDLVPRDNIFKFAKSINTTTLNEIDNLALDNNFILKLKNLFSLYNDNKLCEKNLGINIFRINNNNQLNYKNTIEVRVPNGTLNEVIIQNNINLFAKLLTSLVTAKFDSEYLSYKFKARKINNDIKTFNDFAFEDVLEFVDMIFITEVDKLYFLKQLYKLFNVDHLVLEQKIERILTR